MVSGKQQYCIESYREWRVIAERTWSSDWSIEKTFRESKELEEIVIYKELHETESG